MSEWNEETLDAVWCVDSESGQEVLIDRKTNKIVLYRKDLQPKKE